MKTPFRFSFILAAAVLALGGFAFLVSRPAPKPKAGVALKATVSAPTYPGPTIDVRSYGATCDGKTDDTVAVLTAWTALFANDPNGGTLLVPGMTAVSAGLITPPGFQGHVAVRGTSQAAGFVLLAPISTPLLDFELQAGANQGAGNSADVQDLAFESNFSAPAPIKIAYGVIPSNEASTGPTIRNVKVEGIGWVNGALLVNVWNARVLSVVGFGNSVAYDGLTGGSFLSFSGQCVNETICQVQATFWRSVVSAVAVPGTTFQGFQISQINVVQSPYAFYFDGSQGTACGAIQIANAQIDNGNSHTQSHGYALWASDVGDVNVSGSWAADNSAAPQVVSATGVDGLRISNSTFATGNPLVPVGIALFDCGAATVVDDAIGGWVDAVAIDSASSGCVVQGCHQGEAGPISVSDLGTNDLVGDSRGLTTVVMTTAGLSAQTFYVDATPCSLGHKPSGVAVGDSSDDLYDVRYNWDDVNNSATQVAIVLTPRRNPTIPYSEYVRFTYVVSP